MTDIFYGTSGPRDAKIMVVGEAWGRDEAIEKRPFVGESGRELDKMLAEAGIARKECFATNLIPEQPAKNEMFRFFYPTAEAKTKGVENVRGLYPLPKLCESLSRLEAQILAIKPRLIIGCGNYPMWALTDQGSIGNSTDPSGWKIPTGITLWRGSQLRTRDGGIPFLPIIHPASILRSWSQRPITVHDLRARVPLAMGGNEWRKPSYHYIAPPSFRQCMQYLQLLETRLRRGPLELVADIETTNRTIVCIGFTLDGLSAICIPFLRPTPTGRESYWSLDEEKAIVRRLHRIFRHPNCGIIGQNFIYDIQYIARWWRVRPRVIFDTMLAQHAMFPGTPKALYYLASLYSRDYYSFWKEDSKEWDEHLDLERLLLYNCDDVIYTFKCWQAQKNALIKMEVVDQFKFLMECFYLAFDMMERGIRIDPKERDAMRLRVMEAAQERQEWLNKVVPEWVRPVPSRTAKAWYTSNKQQMELFYEELGLKSVHHRKTGNPTVDDTAMQEIALRYPELKRLTETIRELRSLGVFQNNFLSAAIDPDMRMRCSFNPGGTETFRWSSSTNAFGRGTNLQNIPKGDE